MKFMCKACGSEFELVKFFNQYADTTKFDCGCGNKMIIKFVNCQPVDC